ncbi:MAG: restriction endonuclease subunit S [Desulfovibrionales bacterium]|nr:MAG: restriction endonuclease subunit S [Desulfovibrionales bacterium]
MSDNHQWQTKALRDLAKINYGKSPAGILTEEGEYPVVGTGGVERMGKGYLHEGDSIILGRKGTIDRVQFVTGKFWTIDTAYYLSHFTTSSPLWLYYFLQTIDLRQLNEATGVPSLSRELLYKINISTPPKKEQPKIADILSTVDRAIEQTENFIAKQQRIKNGLMQDLLTKGIDENGNIRSEETHEFKDSPLGRIPVEWDVKILDNVSDIKYGISDAIDTMNKNGIPTITLPCISPDGKLDLSISKIVYTPKKNVKDIDLLMYEDLLFNWRNGSKNHLGKTAFFNIHDEYTHVGFLLRIRAKPDSAFSKFLWYIINYIKENGYFLNAKIQVNNTFNSHELKSVALSFPSIVEQKAICERLDSLEYAIFNTTIRFDKLRSLKTALMQDLLTGKVRVTSLLDGREAGV